MIAMIPKNKRSQTIFMNGLVEKPPVIVFDGNISLEDSPLEVTVETMEASVLATELVYEVLPDPEVEALDTVVIDPFRCGED